MATIQQCSSQFVLFGKLFYNFAKSGNGNASADACPSGWSAWIWTPASIKLICLRSMTLNNHKVCNRVFTYRTWRNWRDEFLVPGFELVNFNDWFLDFNWFLFYWNGNFFLCKSNETGGIKKKRKKKKVIRRTRTIPLLFLCDANAANSGTDLVPAWRQTIPSSASGWACSRLAHPALSSHSGPANKTPAAKLSA